jgi:hypothetical protein
MSYIHQYININNKLNYKLLFITFIFVDLYINHLKFIHINMVSFQLYFLKIILFLIILITILLFVEYYDVNLSNMIIEELISITLLKFFTLYHFVHLLIRLV